MIFDQKMIVDSIFSGLYQLYIAVRPVLIPIIAASIVFLILKFLVKRIVSWCSWVSGCTKKEVRHNVKTAENLMDFLSAANDINQASKK